MEFGRLCSWEQQGNRVYFTFEKGTGRLEVITDRILNVFSGVVSDGHRSKAIEGEKAVETRFCVSEDKGVVTVATDCVTAKEMCIRDRGISDPLRRRCRSNLKARPRGRKQPRQNLCRFPFRKGFP